MNFIFIASVRHHNSDALCSSEKATYLCCQIRILYCYWKRFRATRCKRSHVKNNGENLSLHSSELNYFAEWGKFVKRNLNSLLSKQTFYWKTRNINFVFIIMNLLRHSIKYWENKMMRDIRNSITPASTKESISHCSIYDGWCN